MISLDDERAKVRRACVWAGLSIVLAGSRFVPADILQIVLSGGAIFLALAAAYGCSYRHIELSPIGHVIFAGGSMIVALITGVLIFGWWGIALSLAALVTYLLSARISAR